MITITNPSNTSLWLKLLAFGFLLMAGINSVLASQFSALGVSPTRVVIGAQQKSAAITITNNSETETTYRMKLFEMGRDSKGQFRRLNNEEIPADHRSSIKLVRFSPRQVQLKPGQSQVIRVIARRTRNLAPGEYRSHLQIAALPVITEHSLTDLMNGDGTPVHVQAKSGTNVGISMPVIVLHGQTSANVELKSVQLNTNKDDTITSATVDLALAGNRSTYGHITLQLEDNGDWQDIAMIRGFALYTPFPGSVVQIPVRPEIKADEIRANAKVRVIFENPSAASDKDNHWLDGTVVPKFRKIAR